MARATPGRRVVVLALVCPLFVLVLELPVVRVLVILVAVLAGLGALVLRLRGEPETGAAAPVPAR